MFLRTLLLLSTLALSACFSNSSTPTAAQDRSLAPPIEVQQTFNHDGDSLALDDFRGQVVVLDFWATWCGPCVRSIPHLKQWHQQHADRGLAVIGYTDLSSQNLEAFIEQHAIDYRIAVGSSLGNNDYNVTGIPHLVLIDHEGRMIKRGHPNSFSDDDIESALAAAGY